MKTLNQKALIFVLLCHSGVKASEAYMQAYHVSNIKSARAGARRLLNSPTTKEIVECLQDRNHSKFSEMQARLAAIVRNTENSALQLEALERIGYLKNYF